MSGSEQSGPQSFWVEFEAFLRSFYADLSPSTDSGDLQGSNFWWRASEGSLHLTSDKSRRYHQFLQTCGKQLAPDADISAAAFDSALKDAIFTVADVPGSRTRDVEFRIRTAMDGFRAFVAGPGRGYKCWVEVEGLDKGSLPASFGTTRFVVLGDAEIDALKAVVEEKHTVCRSPGALSHSSPRALDHPGQPVRGLISVSVCLVNHLLPLPAPRAGRGAARAAGGSSRPRSRSGSWRWRAGRVRCCRGSGRRRGRATPRRRGSR